MAEILNKLTAPKNIIGWGTQFNFPGFPVEKNKLFETYADALAYAQGSDSYIGNVISILNADEVNPAGVYVVTGIGATNGAITQVGKETDLSGVETRLTSLESYATVQVSKYDDLLSTYNAGKILYLTQTVDNGKEDDEKVEYLAGAYISLGNGQLQKLSTSDAGGATPEDRLTALETRVSNAETNITNIQNDIYVEGETEGSKVLNIYTKSETDTKIATAISNVYKFKGSAETFPTEGLSNGDVWNITKDVKIGDETYPAGTNFAYVIPETGEPHWDALAGIEDLSGYALKTDLKDWVETTTFNSHVNNEGTALHVTASEKETWSGKQDKITNTNKLSATLVDGLATVATTGSYNDLTDTPDIQAPIGNGSADAPHVIWSTSDNAWKPGKIEALPSRDGVTEGSVLKIGENNTVVWGTDNNDIYTAVENSLVSIDADNKISTPNVIWSSGNVVVTGDVHSTVEGTTHKLSEKLDAAALGFGTNGQILSTKVEGENKSYIWTTAPTVVENKDSEENVINYTINDGTNEVNVYSSSQIDEMFTWHEVPVNE